MSDSTESKQTTCPGCGLERFSQDATPPDRYNASGGCWEVFGELTADTISKNDSAFVHQYCVDAYGAQHAGGRTKPITTAFSLIGLYLAVEQGHSGTQVQQAHMTLAERDDQWPELRPPHSLSDVTVQSVLDASPGEERVRNIDRWMESIWQTWDHAHEWVREVCRESLDIE
jgi:hypothetical protein